jgi:hypothetical protein
VRTAQKAFDPRTVFSTQPETDREKAALERVILRAQNSRLCLATLRSQIEMENFDGFAALWQQVRDEVIRAERFMLAQEQASLNEFSVAQPQARLDVESRFAAHKTFMLAQLEPIVRELQTLKMEADAARVRVASGGPAMQDLAVSSSTIDFGDVTMGEVSRGVDVTFANIGVRMMSSIHAELAGAATRPCWLSNDRLSQWRAARIEAWGSDTADGVF